MLVGEKANRRLQHAREDVKTKRQEADLEIAQTEHGYQGWNQRGQHHGIKIVHHMAGRQPGQQEDFGAGFVGKQPMCDLHESVSMRQGV